MTRTLKEIIEQNAVLFSNLLIADAVDLRETANKARHPDVGDTLRDYAKFREELAEELQEVIHNKDVDALVAAGDLTFEEPDLSEAELKQTMRDPRY